MSLSESGRVVRTRFFLEFMNDEGLRRTINAATNIAEAWNGFVQWVAFGGEDVIREDNRAEQGTIIQYNHLVANAVVFYNAVGCIVDRVGPAFSSIRDDRRAMSATITSA